MAGAAQELGTTQKMIRSRVNRGQLPYRRWGGRIVFLRPELLDFMRALDGVGLAEALANVRGKAG